MRKKIPKNKTLLSDVAYDLKLRTWEAKPGGYPSSRLAWATQ